jgi:hypothetical protein
MEKLLLTSEFGVKTSTFGSGLNLNHKVIGGGVFYLLIAILLLITVREGHRPWTAESRFAPRKQRYC